MGGWDWQCLEVPQRPVQDEHRSKSCFDRHKNCEFWMTVKPPTPPTHPPTPPHPTHQTHPLSLRPSHPRSLPDGDAPAIADALQNGDCSSNPNYMHFMCSRSCGACGIVKPSVAPNAPHARLPLVPTCEAPRTWCCPCGCTRRRGMGEEVAIVELAESG